MLTAKLFKIEQCPRSKYSGNRKSIQREQQKINAEMDSPTLKFEIDLLPLQIIHTIFDNLDLASLKSFSLSCHRWNSIISDYCSQRFVLCINEQKTTSHDRSSSKWDRANERMKEAAAMLETTQRVFRKVHLKKGICEQSLRANINGVLIGLFQPRLLEHLVVLELGLSRHPMEFAREISDAVCKMGCLKELLILYDANYCNGTNECSKMRLTNSSLCKLFLEGVMPSFVNCPNLRMLDIVASDRVEDTITKMCMPHEGQETGWTIQQVEKLSIVGPSCGTDSSTLWFYQQMAQLTILNINEYYITASTLSIICESCVSLEELFIGTLVGHGRDTLCCLSNLPNLKQFGIWRAVNNPITFESVQLPKLEKLRVGPIITLWESLSSIPSIQWLQMKPLFNNGRVEDDTVSFILSSFYVALSTHLNHLRFLWIDLHVHRNPREIWDQLPKMLSLGTLVLENIIYLKPIKCLPCLPQLQRLVIYRCSKKVYERFHNDSDFTKRFKNIEWIGVGLKIPEEINRFTDRFE